MTAGDLRVEIADGIAELTLDRPVERNAFSGPMAVALADAYRECDARDDARAVILTGAGNSFCVGADFAAGADTFAKRDEPEFSADPIAFPPWQVRKPFIAAINGHAVGIGLTLAIQCDIRLVASEAKLAFAHVRRGVLPDAHSHCVVPRTIGFAKTAELFLTGRLFTGDEAATMGLASKAMPAAEVLPAARAMARDIERRTGPPLDSSFQTTPLGLARAHARRDRRPRNRGPSRRNGPPRRPRRRDGIPRTTSTAVDARSAARLAQRADAR